MDLIKDQTMALNYAKEKLEEIEEIVYLNEPIFLNKNSFKERKNLIKPSGNWVVDYCQNMIRIQLSFNEDLIDLEETYYLPTIVIDMTMAQYKDSYENSLASAEKANDLSSVLSLKRLLNNTPLLKVYATTVTKYPIGFDNEGDKVNIVHELYYSNKKIESKNILKKIIGYIGLYKCLFKLKTDYRERYSLEFNLPVSKL